MNQAGLDENIPDVHLRITARCALFRTSSCIECSPRLSRLCEFAGPIPQLTDSCLCYRHTYSIQGREAHEPPERIHRPITRAAFRIRTPVEEFVPDREGQSIHDNEPFLAMRSISFYGNAISPSGGLGDGHLIRYSEEKRPTFIPIVSNNLIGHMCCCRAMHNATTLPTVAFPTAPCYLRAHSAGRGTSRNDWQRRESSQKTSIVVITLFLSEKDAICQLGLLGADCAVIKKSRDCPLERMPTQTRGKMPNMLLKTAPGRTNKKQSIPLLSFITLYHHSRSYDWCHGMNAF